MKLLLRNYKFWLCVAAVFIAGISLFVSNRITKELATEERKRVGVWGEAMRSMLEANESTDLNLVLTILNDNTTIPVVVLDERGEVLDFRNLGTLTDTAEIRKEALALKTKGQFMQTPLAEGSLFICYGESINLQRLAWYPYIQLGIVSLFVIVAIIALLYSKKAEQNRVWVGLSKETAHQLGTPISALMAWSEMFQSVYPDDPLFAEMEKDVHRLKLVADRFSKIGSVPELVPYDLCAIVSEVVEYIRRRAPRRVSVTQTIPDHPVIGRTTPELLQWVLENLLKNGLDAMHDEGALTVTLTEEDGQAVLLVSDTGRGILRKHFKTVFHPGFTTKKRGWGLGLSLAKRIVEDYHHGRIYVKSSTIGKGTTFCIELALFRP